MLEDAEDISDRMDENECDNEVVVGVNSYNFLTIAYEFNNELIVQSIRHEPLTFLNVSALVNPPNILHFKK